MESIVKKFKACIFTVLVICTIECLASGCNKTDLSDETKMPSNKQIQSDKNISEELFSMFSDKSYESNMTDCSFSNGYKYKITGEASSKMDGEVNGVFLKAFTLLNDEDFAGVIEYGEKETIEKNVCETYVSADLIERGDSLEDTKQNLLEEEGYMNNDDYAENKYNIDIVDVDSLISADEFVNTDDLIDIANSEQGILKTYNSDGTITQGYNDGTTLMAEVMETYDDSVSIFIIKRIDEGGYVKIFKGIVNAVDLTAENIEAIKKLEHTAKIFESTRQKAQLSETKPITYKKAKSIAEKYLNNSDILLGGDTSTISHNGRQAYSFTLRSKSMVENGGSGTMGANIYVYADNGEIDY